MHKWSTIGKALFAAIIGLTTIAVTVSVIRTQYIVIGGLESRINSQGGIIRELKAITPDWRSHDYPWDKEGIERVREMDNNRAAVSLLFTLFWCIITAVAVGFYVGRVSKDWANKQ